MTTEEKFNAAVNVIRSLPKNGSYQPSKEMMLRFYAYYKQATIGPVLQSNEKKVPFWDMVGRMKYTAWAKLKNMSKEEAMRRYVEELQRIVETMSYSNNVANFLQAEDLEVLESLPAKDLQLIAGDIIERVRSQPGSPLSSRPSSPINGALQKLAANISPQTNGLQNGLQNEESDDEYIDSVDVNSIDSSKSIYALNNSTNHNHNNVGEQLTNGSVSARGSTNSSGKYVVDVSNEISKIVASMQTDIRSLELRVQNLEKGLHHASTTELNRQIQKRQLSFSNISPMLMGFLILWPFVAIRISNKWKFLDASRR